MTNAEYGNIIIGLILGELYEQWPIPLNIRLSHFVEKLAEIADEDRKEQLLIHTIGWLEEEGFVRIKSRTLGGFYIGVSLSEKAMVVLNQIPDSLSEKKNVGQVLAEGAKDIGTEATKSALGDTIGQVLGGFFKSVSS